MVTFLVGDRIKLANKPSRDFIYGLHSLHKKDNIYTIAQVDYVNQEVVITGGRYGFTYMFDEIYLIEKLAIDWRVKDV